MEGQGSENDRDINHKYLNMVLNFSPSTTSADEIAASHPSRCVLSKSTGMSRSASCRFVR